MRSVLAGLVIACATAAASAQTCRLYRHYIPDFDQVRTDLPNSGNMYCVPTSVMNLLGYIANHGVPGVLDGPRNWQDNANYPFITQRLQVMGILMGTSPTNGTFGGPAALGLRAYLAATAPGKFVVSNYYGDYSVSNLAAHFVLGRLVNVCYGFYNPDNFGRYSRNGGHCVTLCGLIDFCNPSYTLRWRDPATGGITASDQSIFMNGSSNASSQVFIDGGNFIHSRIRLWDLGNDSSRRYLDGILTISPLVALTGSITTRDRFTINIPGGLLGPGISGASHAVIPGGNPITEIALDPQQVDAFAVTYQKSTHLWRLYRRNLATGQTSQLLSVEVPMSITTGRHGELFVGLGDSMRRYSIAGDAFTLLQQTDAPGPFKIIRYDDTRDEVVGITATDHLVRFQRDLGLLPASHPLPAGVGVQGSASLAIDEASRKYYIAGALDNEIAIVAMTPGTNVPLLEGHIALPAVQHPEQVQFTDEGTLILISDGVVAEFENGPAGWIARAGSSLAGLPAAGQLVIGRSRTNFTPGVHDTPEWNNVLVDEGLNETPDCLADFNLDGVVNSQDFFDYVTAFFAADPSADFNYSGAIDSQDFFDFISEFFTGCA